MDWLKLGQLGLQIFGAVKGAKGAGKAADQYGAGLAALQALTPPELEDLSVHLQELILQGQITPEEYVSYMQEQSEMEGIQIPQEVIDSQYQVLGDLKGIVDAGGSTATDRARVQEIRDQALTTARGTQKATQQEFAARGMSGSGTELASRLAGDSANITAASKAGFDTAALAEEAKLKALGMLGDQSNTMRTQEFGEKAAKASAADSINRFNTTARQTTSNANTLARNQAQAQNLAERQRIADQNIGIKNAQTVADANTRQQVYTNELDRARAMMPAGQAAGAGTTAKNTTDANRIKGYVDALPGVIDTFGDIFGKKETVSDERQKTGITEMSDQEVDDILDRLTGSKFKYARQFDDGRTHVGVMAQDVEQTPLSGAVEEGNDGVKRINNDEVATAALAMLANHHKRLKNLEGV